MKSKIKKLIFAISYYLRYALIGYLGQEAVKHNNTTMIVSVVIMFICIIITDIFSDFKIGGF